MSVWHCLHLLKLQHHSRSSGSRSRLFSFVVHIRSYPSPLWNVTETFDSISLPSEMTSFCTQERRRGK